MWKIAHTDWNTTPGRKVAQDMNRPAISMNTNSPAYMLPNNRMPRLTGLDRYSTRFRNRFGPASTTLPITPCAWNGAVNSSLVKPQPPLTLIE